MAMKKIFMMMLLAGGFALNGHAQTDDSLSHSTKQALGAPEPGVNVRTNPPTKVNPRKIYKSKKTGQKATITGHQATGSNGGSAPYPKNAAKHHD